MCLTVSVQCQPNKFTPYGFEKVEVIDKGQGSDEVNYCENIITDMSFRI
jgi:hypothetical protein